MGIRTCVYARVSSKKSEQAQSLENQKEKYKQYCEEKGYDLIKVYPDDGKTATNARREAFQMMMYDCGIDFEKNDNGSDIFRRSSRKSKYDLVIVKDPSRMSRSTVDGITSVKQLKSNGVDVLFENSGMSTFDSNWEFNLSILFSIAQNESQNLSNRIKFTKNHNAKNGKYAPARLPYGYVRNEENEFVIDEEQAEVIRYIYKRYIEAGAYIIVREINEQGYKSQTGVTWSEHMVNRIIKNYIYTGTAIVGKLSKDSVTETKTSATPKDKHIYIPNAVPSIISVEQWEEANRIRESRINKSSKSGRKPIKNDVYYPKLYCSKCGSRFVRHMGAKKKITYMCQKRKHGKIKECNARGISVNILDEMFSRVTVKQNTNFMSNQTYYKALMSGLDSEAKKLDQRIYELDKQIKELEDDNKETFKTLKKEMKSSSEVVRKMFQDEINDNAKKIEQLNKKKESYNLNVVNDMIDKVKEKSLLMENIQMNKRIKVEDKHKLLKKVIISDYDCEFFFSLPSFEEEIHEFNSIFTSAQIETNLTFEPFTETFKREHKASRDYWNMIDEQSMEDDELRLSQPMTDEEYDKQQEEYKRAYELINKQS
ncbi:recombinase family protein [Psychrobacillus sp. BM2]|uniref:recombinase family protein n=1 Tax=Psychrobacillus sp. BM2 TaxID=3400421 RepID=UPI003B01C079